MGVRRVDGQHVHFRADQLLRALQKIAGGSDGRAHAQTALGVLRRVRVLQLLLNVLDGDQTLEHVMVVHHQQLFDAVPVQDRLRLLQRGAHRNGNQVLLGHHLRDRQIEARFKAQVAIGENADQLCRSA